jgi:phage tail-like protein
LTRGVVEGLLSPWPIARMLPGMYADDDFAQRFTSVFDVLTAPVHVTLDCIDAYFDPWLTPPDMLDWLATWVGAELDEVLPIDRRRLLVAEAVRLYRVRGTALGLAEFLAIFTGLEVEIEESGGATWSSTPGGQPPGEDRPRLLVRLIADDPESVNVARIDSLVRAAKPAHVPHTVEVVRP